MMLINDIIKVFFSQFQGAAGMQGSADLVKLCFLEITNEILSLFNTFQGIFSDFYVVF